MKSENNTIDSSVEFGCNTIIKDNVQIEENVKIGNNVIIYSDVIIKKDSIIQDFVVLGKKPFSTKGTGGAQVLNTENQVTIIGSESIISTNSVIYSDVIIGCSVIVAEMAVVREGVKIGNEVTIGKHSIIEYGVEVSNNTKINAHVLIGEKMRIGSNTFIGPNVSTACDTYMNANKLSELTPPKIGDNVRIGENTTLHPGVIINDNAKIGAGCLIISDVREGTTVIQAESRNIGKL